MENKTIISIDKLKKIAIQKGLNKYIKEIRYSTVKNKKYCIITIDNKRVNFGDIRYENFLQHHDEERRKRFK